jgi:pyruvate,water dikinase|tara:strand:- start:1992 stop:4382 length:2391 start_codon:yes stop_codon:yes gene_type:complete
MSSEETGIVWFKDCSYNNKHLVGGKCSSLGELHYLAKMINFEIADGYAVTTTLYDRFIEENNLTNIIQKTLSEINVEDIIELEERSNNLKKLVTYGTMNEEDMKCIVKSYHDLCELYNTEFLEVAVRSSAVAEDLPNASFAGQQDTYLNIKGDKEIIDSVKSCFASLFNSRAISYRKTHNIQLEDVKISVAVQKMVRSDIGSAGVAFSIDPETGYNKAIVINSAYGLGELVVSGGVKPDEVILDKRVLRDIDGDPILTKNKGDKQTKIVYGDTGVIEVPTNNMEKTTYSINNSQSIALGRYVLLLEESYSKMFKKSIGVDVEWAIDGTDHKIYIIQTRPETVHSNNNTSNMKLIKYILREKSDILVKGVAVGDKISTGKVRVMTSILDYKEFNRGDILVTDMTTPDWEPIMKISSGIITNKGGRTCHAAIVARELGLNAVVGCGNATDLLTNDTELTISCSEGETGNIYKGLLKYDIESLDVNTDLNLPIKLMMNVGNPENSFTSSMIPNSGVGLARLEFIVSNYIKIHPLALCDYPKIRTDVREKIYDILGSDHHNGKWYFIKRLARGISKIASAFYPNNVIVRLSDFKSNEYRNLIGGELYEPNEENPMIGWRGASRYYSPEYEKGFELECQAIQYARNKMKMSNIVVMIPFCRTPKECQLVLDKMKEYGLQRGENGLQVYLMCEIPSNVIEADCFSPMIDGISIGGNDLLQLTLGVDRDSEKITHLSSDENLSYRRMISMAIKTYKDHGVKVGFCGQQPSDSTEFCDFLIKEGIDSISVTPDSALKTIINIGK